MKEGGEIFKATRASNMVKMLTEMVNLAFWAPLLFRGWGFLDWLVSWQDNSVITYLIRSFSDKINNCASRHPDNHSELYCLFIYREAFLIQI